MPRPPCALLALLFTGCAGMYPTPPPPPPLDGLPLARFDRVDPGLYRGSQPSAAALQELVARYQIRTVVKLNPTTESRDVVPPGVRLIYRPLSAVRVPSPETVHELLETIDAAAKPVFVHCQHGEDRTGLVVALYRIRHGAPVDQAYLDMMLHGFHPYRGVWGAFAREVGWNDGRGPGRDRRPATALSTTSAAMQQ